MGGNTSGAVAGELGPHDHDGHYTHTQQLNTSTNQPTIQHHQPLTHRQMHRPHSYQVMSPEEVRIRESSRNRQEER